MISILPTTYYLLHGLFAGLASSGNPTSSNKSNISLQTTKRWAIMMMVYKTLGRDVIQIQDKGGTNPKKVYPVGEIFTVIIHCELISVYLCNSWAHLSCIGCPFSLASLFYHAQLGVGYKYLILIAYSFYFLQVVYCLCSLILVVPNILQN